MDKQDTTQKNTSELMIAVSGTNESGVTSRLLKVVLDGGGALLDVQKSALPGCSALVLRIREAEGTLLLEPLKQAASELGVTLESLDVDAQANKSERYVLTLIGADVDSAGLGSLLDGVDEGDARVSQISRLAPSAIEIQFERAPGSDAASLRASLEQLAAGKNFDIALQREGLLRRNKRLVVFDMDSTLIPLEFIDEIAKMHGVSDQVSAVTARAMRGEMDYDESLRQRLGLLRGLEIRKVEEMAAGLPLTKGAERLIRVLRHLGYRTAVISGGFSVATEALKARLGLDHAHSNVLEVENGKLTGRVVGAVVNGAKKAELLQSIADGEGISLDQVIAIGDGANDVLMLERAGLGVAFHAKPRLQAAADISISTGGLDGLLYVLGMSEDDIEEVMSLA